MIFCCISILMIIQIHVLESTLLLSIDVWFDKFNLVDSLDTEDWDFFYQILRVESPLNDFAFSCEPPWHVKKVSSCTNVHNFKPYNQRSENYQKRKIVIIQMVFAFWWWQHKSLILTHKFRAFSHVLFSSRQCLLTANLNLVSFQPF